MTEPTADNLTLPIKRTTGDTLEDRLTGNAYHNILPARYLQKDQEGDLVESQEDLFERVANNIALAEAVFEAERRETAVTVTPDQLKPDHPRRDELAAEVFGAGTTADDDTETALTAHNVNKFAYETVVPDLPAEIREHVEGKAAEFRELMEQLSFIPNSPTLMNAGDELQQLSACFVDSPADDLTDIHQTAKEAAEVFQCLTADASVRVAGKGSVSVADVEPGDEIVQRAGDGYRTQRVDEIHAYEDAPTRHLETECGIGITGTPNHRLLVDDEWTELADVRAGDTVSVRLDWLADADPTVPLTTVGSGAGWADARTVSNEAIAALHAEGLSDAAIADRLDCSESTVHRRRVEELGVDAAAVGQLRRTQDRETEAVSPVTQPETLTSEVAELVGLWIGTGSLHDHGIRFHVAREPVLERIDRLARDLFATGADWRWTDGGYEVVIHSHEIKRWWQANVGTTEPSAAELTTPDPITRGGRTVAAAFLRGLFTAAGTLHEGTTPRLSGPSEALIDGGVQLLLGLGIPAQKRTCDGSETPFAVEPAGTAGARAFVRQIGFVDGRTERVEAALESGALDAPIPGTIDGATWAQPVVAVVDAGERTVYDLTVADEPEYLANSVVSHNSGGGMGYAFWKLRPFGDPVGSTGGIASGPITFMRTFDQMCFPPGTDILTPAGQRPIETLQAGDVVVDEDGAGQRVTEAMERQIDEEIVEITPERLNRPIRATTEHPFKVARENRFEWVDAGDLTEGDLLVLGHSTTENDLSIEDDLDLSTIAAGPLVITDGGVSINREYYDASKGPKPERLSGSIPVADFACIAGWYLAEGCVVYRRGIPNEVTFTLNIDEDDAASEIRSAVESFNVPVRVDHVPERNAQVVHVESSSFAQLIEGLFGTGAAEKRVPDVLWSAPPAVQAQVLQPLFEGDGTLEKRGPSQRAQLQLANEAIIDFVFQAGLRCGVQFSRHEREPDGKLPVYWVSASVSSAIGTPLEGLFDAIPEGFRVTDRTKQAHNREVVAIDSIDTVAYEGPVYNIEVDDTHTYVAEDLVVHNCETIAQGGTRRGAQMGVMRVSHPDVIEFIHAKNKDVSLAHCLRLNDPDDYTYTSFSEALAEARDLIDDEGRVPKHLRNAVEGHLSNFNVSVGVTDGFMEALDNGEEYVFTNPRTEEPHIATEETREMYARYGLGEYVEPGEVLSIPAEIIWERIVEGAHENGEPGVIYLERVNKEHSFDVAEHPDHRILATNPCLAGDMQVQLADGRSRPIQDLADADGKVEVVALEDGEIVSRPATAFQTKRDTTVLEIETTAGRSLTATPDHEIRMPGGEWTEVKDLTPGDRVVAATKPVATFHGPALEQTTETVASIEPAGRADVYDLSVAGSHNFFASADGDASINVHNCGEQPLEEYEACNLGHINLSTLAAEDAPDWRVWYDDHAAAYPTVADAVEAFLAEAIDFEAFDYRIELGTRFLENVVTMSDFPVPEIERKVREMRKIGLGIMGLAQLYIQLGIRYGSEEGNEVARQLMTHINHRSKWASHELAEERGVFDEWANSKYADPPAYAEWFEKQTGLDAEEWAEGFPIRNHNTTTIAPTGTTSMLGNTTGGCEPIYNVAYYKNVSDDVQGDEMLVEFDDYFLRTLEANDIDVSTVKAEAQEQMAANEFDGVDGLSTVPNSIGELFVVTGDLSAKEHAAVQCACQAGVDSAISKTVNAPNNSSVEDAKEVFEYIYAHGGKGVTYYRDGTRSKQVLTTRAENADFAEMDEAEAAEVLAERIEEVFGGFEAFLDQEAVQAFLEDDLPEILDGDQPAYAGKQPRPDLLHGVTQRIDTGYGKLYVTINEDTQRERPFELFATIGNSGGFTASFTEALAKTISTALRSGIDPHEIADELQGIRSPKVAWDKGEQINSIPDAIGVALRRYLDDEIDKPYPQQQSLADVADEPRELDSIEPDTDAEPPEPDGGATVERSDDTDSIIASGDAPECPTCGSLSLNYAEGCKTCESCGWSEC